MGRSRLHILMQCNFVCADPVVDCFHYDLDPSNYNGAHEAPPQRGSEGWAPERRNCCCRCMANCRRWVTPSKLCARFSMGIAVIFEVPWPSLVCAGCNTVFDPFRISFACLLICGLLSSASKWITLSRASTFPIYLLLLVSQILPNKLLFLFCFYVFITTAGRIQLQWWLCSLLLRQFQRRECVAEGLFWL